MIGTKTIEFVMAGLALLFVPAAVAQHPTSARETERIQREVRHELVMLPYYSVFDDLEYSVNGETVTLMGQVTRPALKSDAESAVKQIEGVSKVVNNIEALPPSPTDDTIRRAVYVTLFSERSSLFRYGWAAIPSIHILVKGGRVTLTGIVDSEADKNTAGLLANGVPGIFSVTNNLKVAKP